MVNPIILIILPLFTAFLIYITNSFLKSLSKILSFLALAFNLVIATMLISPAFQKPINVIIAGFLPPIGINLLVGPIAIVFTLIITLISILSLIYSINYIDDENFYKYYPLFLLLYTGSIGMVLTNDIFNLYVFFEILCISSYSLVAYHQHKNSLEAAIKYLILGSFGSIFILIAIGIVYIKTGTLNMSDLADKAHLLNKGSLPTVIILFLTGLGVEAAIFPLNAWLPDAHSSAPSSISALLSGFVIEIALLVIFKIFYSIFQFTAILPYLTILAVITLVIGEFAAFKQTNIKRMLAYSSIGQLGLIMFAFSLNSQAGISAGILQVINHAFSKALLFLTAGYIIIKRDSYELSDYKSISKTMPFTTFAFAIGALSLIGVPPFFGFFSKLNIILAALKTGSPANLIMVFVIVGTTVIETAYFIKVLQIFYAKTTVNINRNEAPFLPIFSFAVLAILIIFAIIYFQDITYFTNKAATDLLTKFSLSNLL